jgi:Glycosyltransferase family 87
VRKSGLLDRTARTSTILTTLWGFVIAFLVWFALASPRYAHVDFVPFYCAGDAIAHGADPYREMPLYACEHSITSGGLYAARVTVPAPLPPYALIAYALLSRLPFDPAYLVVTGLSLAALSLGCGLLGVLTGAKFAFLAAAIASTALDSVRKGQPIPLVFLAIVAAGWALARGRDRLAALLAAATMIEPHIGIPLCAALFLWRPKTRPSLLGTGAAFVALSLTVVPLHVAVSYVTDVLPLHAASEAAWVTQLSLVSALVLFGVPIRTALEMSIIQYLVCACMGVFVAGRVAKHAGAAEGIAFVPPIFAALGGTYVHGNLLMLAIPGALFLVHRTGSAAAFIAVAAVAISWLSISEPVQFVVCVLTSVTIAFTYRPQLIRALSVAAGVAAVGIIHGSVEGAPRRASAAMLVHPAAYAEHSWAEFVRDVNPPPQAQIVALMMKLPTWAGLLFLSGLAAYQVRPRTAPSVRVSGTGEMHEPS